MILKSVFLLPDIRTNKTVGKDKEMFKVESRKIIV